MTIRNGHSQSYWTFRIRGYPTTSPLIVHFHTGSDDAAAIGKYMEGRGSAVLRDHMSGITPVHSSVAEEFCAEERVHFSGASQMDSDATSADHLNNAPQANTTRTSHTHTPLSCTRR